MIRASLSRRQFTTTLGAGLGAALVEGPFGARRAEAGRPSTRPGNTPADAVLLNSNENPYGPAASALDAITKSESVAARYPDAAEARLTEAIARLHGVAADRVVLGCGSGEVLQMADMAFLGPGKKVVVAEPTFEAVLGYARVTKAEPVKVPLTADFRHDLPRMAAACDAGTGLVYVCNPNNPTGTIVTKDELAFFLERVPRTVSILVDEAYHHFVDDPHYASAFEWIDKAPNVVVVRTFSKVYGMAGMRLGYAVSSKENAEALRAHAAWSNANAAVLAAALASLAESDHVPRQRSINREIRDWLCRELERDGRRYIPSHANFLMVDVGGDVQPLIDSFRERRILVGRKFPSLPNWLRVSMGTKPEMQAFVDGLRAIAPARAARAS
ncbi:MAG: histidinol-phosphate transaminase [Acidobacteria bacterium]|nr:MAG: histidinol-phosphate transaminase [Acidobacteriota bacterium]